MGCDSYIFIETLNPNTGNWLHLCKEYVSKYVGNQIRGEGDNDSKFVKLGWMEFVDLNPSDLVYEYCDLNGYDLGIWYCELTPSLRIFHTCEC